MEVTARVSCHAVSHMACEQGYRFAVVMATCHIQYVYSCTAWPTYVHPPTAELLGCTCYICKVAYPCCYSMVGSGTLQLRKENCPIKRATAYLHTDFLSAVLARNTVGCFSCSLAISPPFCHLEAVYPITKV